MSDFNNIVVYIDLDSLVYTKSGNPRPKNIADFMPDYNVWYSLKFMNPEKIIILSNRDLTADKEKYGLQETDTRLKFIQIWLKEMTEIKNILYFFSILGDCKYYLGGQNLLTLGIRGYEKDYKKIFISKKDYSEITNSLGIDFINTQDFINTYNKNPREYKKEPKS